MSTQNRVVALNPQTATTIQMAAPSGARAIAFSTGAELMQFAHMMASANIGVPKHLRDQPGACLAVIMQAERWGLDPFQVANKSYFVNDRIAFEAQLIAAVINTQAPLLGRLHIEHTGQGSGRRAVITGTFRSDPTPKVLTTPAMDDIKTKNSPLWGSDPDQQLGYYGVRAWARRFCPEVILGIYDPEELAEASGPEHARDITPPPRPRPEQFEPAPQAAIAPPVSSEPEWDTHLAEKACASWDKRAAALIAAFEAAPDAAALVEAEAKEPGLRQGLADNAGARGLWWAQQITAAEQAAVERIRNAEANAETDGNAAEPAADEDGPPWDGDMPKRGRQGHDDECAHLIATLEAAGSKDEVDAVTEGNKLFIRDLLGKGPRGEWWHGKIQDALVDALGRVEG